MKMQKPFVGVIEGFYGNAWSWRCRQDYARFLQQQGFQFYVYAPKADSFLRHRWADKWPDAHWQSLFELRQAYRQEGVQWGLGFSPFELYLDWGAEKKRQLIEKIKQINTLQPDIFCLLFDDMSGDKSDMASLQADIAHLVAQTCNASQLIVCPTYYSFDPVLEEIFGPCPKNYWSDLGKFLDQDIAVFWTGDKVCSTEYTHESLQRISDELHRTPFIWDNYPVNDGRVTSQYLHIKSFEHRPYQMAQWCSGHAVNPMNAASLSKIPLQTLMASYHLQQHYDPDEAFSVAVQQVCGEELARCLQQDVELIQQLGLDQLTLKQSRELLQRYSEFDHPCATEVCHWLQGHYRFDPACLTG